MQFRNLGSGGPELSVVGFGAWAIGGPWQYGWGPQDDDESLAALHRAFDLGINWVDTAAVYGLGHSEEVVGQAVREHGTDVFIFTKCGLNWYGRADREPQNDLRPESIRFELEQSLKRLGTDHVDLYQFHWPDTATGTPVEESWATMADLVAEGKVRWAGVCNFDVELLERCEPIRHVDSLQPPLSLLDRAALRDLLPWCERHGSGVIAYSPMASGLLTGGFDAERMRALAADDWRHQNPDFQEPRLGRNLALVERLQPIAERHGTTVAAVSVAWVIDQQGSTGAIVGARRPSQIDGWIAAGTLRLSAQDLDEIAAALQVTGAGQD
ncbi:MAG TPA: aldo/keto reductase [Actinomycetota bacterium]